MNRVIARPWKIVEKNFTPEQIQHYETIFTLGNGYLGTRGTFEEDYAETKPGTFIAGTFDQAPGEVTEIPNFADWTVVEIELAGERFDLKRGEISAYKRVLNLKQGTLKRRVKWKSPAGNVTELVFERFASLANQHKLGIKITIKPENYSGTVRLSSSLDGQVTNSGTQHFIEQEKCAIEEKGIYLVQTTQQSKLEAALVALHQVSGGIEELKVDDEYSIDRRKITYHSEFEVTAGEEYNFEKMAGVYTTRDVENPKEEAIKAAEDAVSIGYSELLAQHVKAWANEWETADVKIVGPTFDQLAIRFSIFHQLQMTHKTDDRVSIAAKGLSGEGYKGHVFWDNEIFNLPFFIYNYPQAAKTLLKYRYNTLDGARKKAEENGYQGAQFAWESARTGEETTPRWGGLDVKTGKPIRIWCGDIEEHITADVAYGIWHYYQATGDDEFLYNYGAEILLETARFWASRVEYNKAQDKYEITNVIGPDEYSEHVDNDVYTNMLVKWQLNKTQELTDKLKKEAPEIWRNLKEEIGISEQEIKEYQEIADKIFINYREEDQLYVQYEGFFDDPNIDDKIQEAKENNLFMHQLLGWEEINNSQVLKQPDVIMLQYLLSDQFAVEEKKAAWEVYEPKTVHDSSLSPAIHAIVAVEMGDIEKAYDYFTMSSNIDLTVGGSEKGLHAASLGGLWQAVVNGFAGLRVTEEKVELNPQLPEVWEKLQFSIYWHNCELEILLTEKRMKINISGAKREIPLEVNDQEYQVKDKKIIGY